MEQFNFKHTSVLLSESISALNINPNGIYVDATLGGGGHSEAILKLLSQNGRLIGIDRDKTAISAASERLVQFPNFTAAYGNFSNLKSILSELNIDKINGILFDFGVSSPQLDNAERGFSFMHDAPLDMRMDMAQPLTAYDIINSWQFDALKEIFYKYGEERFSPQIAAAIADYRTANEIKTTGQLAEIVRGALPAKSFRDDPHPEKRVFQAVRIAVNGELDAIETALAQAAELVCTGGRIAAISFHSLEDRVVKQIFSSLSQGCTCPKDFPVCVCGNKPKIKIISKKPICAAKDELEINPRARSAKLRIAEII